MTGRRQPVVVRVRRRRPGSPDWTHTRYYTLPAYAFRRAARWRDAGFVVEVSVADLGVWAVQS